MPNFFSATPIPQTSSFRLVACTDSPQLESQEDQRSVTERLSPLVLPPSPQAAPVAIKPTTSETPSSEESASTVGSAVAVGVGAVAASGLVAGVSSAASSDNERDVATTISSVAEASALDGPEVATIGSDIESAVADNSPFQSEPAGGNSSKTPIPPHLLSPIPPSRPQVPSTENEDNGNSVDQASSNVVSVGQVVDDNVRDFSATSGIVGSPNPDSSVTTLDPGMSYADQSSSNTKRQNTSKSDSFLTPNFIVGFIIGFGIIIGLLIMGTRMFRGSNAGNPPSPSETTTEQEQ